MASEKLSILDQGKNYYFVASDKGYNFFFLQMKARCSAGDGINTARWLSIDCPFTPLSLVQNFLNWVCFCSSALATRWTGTCLAMFPWTRTTRWTCHAAGGTPWCLRSPLPETWQKNYRRLTILLGTCRLVQVRWCCISSCTYMAVHTEMYIHSFRCAHQCVQRRQRLCRPAYTVE